MRQGDYAHTPPSTAKDCGLSRPESELQLAAFVTRFDITGLLVIERSIVAKGDEERVWIPV
jgi:hypothetical protein